MKSPKGKLSVGWTVKSRPHKSHVCTHQWKSKESPVETIKPRWNLLRYVKGVLFRTSSLAKGTILVKIGLANGTTLNILVADGQNPIQNLVKKPLSLNQTLFIKHSKFAYQTQCLKTLVTSQNIACKTFFAWCKHRMFSEFFKDIATKFCLISNVLQYGQTV